MNDLEARLRRVLHEELDPVVADPARAATVATSARRRRRLRVLAAALTTIAVGTAGVVALRTFPGTDPLPPSSGERTRASFVADLGEGRTVLVALDAEQRQVCYGADNVPVAYSVVLRREGEDVDPVVVTFVDSGVAYAPVRCGSIGEGQAMRLAATPEGHYIRFGTGFGAISGTLRTFDPDPGRIPYEAEIVCGPGGAVALTPQVRPQHDGVHLNVANFGGGRGELYLVTPDGGNGIFDLPADHALQAVVYFAPGPVQIGCKDHVGFVAFDGPGSERHAHLEIVDRYGLWSQPELECGDGRRKRTIPTDVTLPHMSAAVPRFESLIRTFVPGVLPGDVLERPGYPDAPAKLETRTVVRDGRRIAKVWLTRKGGVWALVPSTCPGSGIAEPG